jgi:1-acyl-sn-glycerol-3-phosphate acyltransferase
MRKYLLRFIYSFLVRGFLKLIVGVKFDNAKFLLNEKQFILVANHNSHLDTMTLLASLPSKILHRVKPVAAADHFGKSKLQEKLSHYFVNALLISRKRDKEHPEKDPIHNMVEALDEGYSLILFPEGTRGEPEKEQPLKPGIAMVLLQRPGVCYVPAYMKGMGKAMPKGDNLIVPFQSSIRFGHPTRIEQPTVEKILQQIAHDFAELKSL